MARPSSSSSWLQSCCRGHRSWFGTYVTQKIIISPWRPRRDGGSAESGRCLPPSRIPGIAITRGSFSVSRSAPNEFPVTPNDFIHTDPRGRHRYRDWSVRVHGTWEGPWSTRITPLLRHQSGAAFGRTLVARLNYGAIRVRAEPIGARPGARHAARPADRERSPDRGCKSHHAVYRNIQYAQRQPRAKHQLGDRPAISKPAGDRSAANRPSGFQARLVTTTR